jgi:hypothetical protein
MATEVPIKKLILVPAIITFAITLLRLIGELNHWSPKLFNPAPGGGGALVGITWLVPIFGIYFAVKLIDMGEVPASAGPAIVYPLIGGLLVPVVGFVFAKLGVGQQSFTMFAAFVVASIVGAVIAFRGWPALAKTLLAYGLAARIPVAVVMLFAILGNWGTHYDVAPPGFPAMAPITKWLLIGVLPQMTVWLWFTIAAGALLGGITVALSRRARRPATA